MALIDQINVVSCGGGQTLGTGTQGCPFDWDRIVGLEFSSGDYAYTSEQNLVNIQEAQQKKEIIIVNGFESFKSVEAAPNISTSEGSGEKSVDGENPYEYEGSFKNKGKNFWNAMRRLNSNGVYNVAFYDKNGAKIMTQSKGGIIKGFKTSMVFTDAYPTNSGNTPVEFKFQMQLADVSIKEMEQMVWITEEQSDYSITNLEGVNDIIFEANPLAVAATSLVVKAKKIDKTHFAGGLTTADFLVKRNGVVVAHTSVVANPTLSTYTLTIPAATAGTYTVETKNAFGTNVVLVASNGLLYQSNIASVIVA